VGKALDNTGFKVLGCVFTAMLVVVWFFVFGMMIRAVRQRQILWPQKQEDREESDWSLQRRKPVEAGPIRRAMASNHGARAQE